MSASAVPRLGFDRALRPRKNLGLGALLLGTVFGLALAVIVAGLYIIGAAARAITDRARRIILHVTLRR